MRRRRIWSEDVPFDVLRSKRVLALCRRFGLALLAAVRPGGEGELPALASAADGEGVELALWPMLDDASGRWANAGNAHRFERFVLGVVGCMEASGRAPREIAFDLEPAIADVRALLAAHPFAARSLRPLRARFDAGRGVLEGLAEGLRARGLTVSAAAVPLLLFERDGGDAWQALLGTPLDGLGLSHVSVMLYTSILEGWSRGALDRAASRALLAACARAALARYGERAGLSLGAVGVGAFGDEPVYRGPAELADDVGIARAAGVDDLTLLDLGGVLGRPRPEAWLEAFVETPAARELPPLGWRAGAALGLARLGTALLPAVLRR